MKKKPLYLLDAYSVIYRSYFAFIKRPLRNSRGENTSAVYGFFQTFFMLAKEYSAEFFLVVFDSKTPTFRHEMYKEYKATREKAPDDLHPQVDVIENMLEKMNIPALRVNGYEADDIIASLVSTCKKENRPCYIVSGDKDLVQLLEKDIYMIKPSKGSYITYAKEDVPEEWGIQSEQILDYLALVGDTSDNIPGVTGIGKKTTVKLLNSYQSLEAIYKNLDKITSKSQREKLEKGKESAFLSKKLATLIYDLTLDQDLNKYSLEALDIAAAKEDFLDQGMKRFAEEYTEKESRDKKQSDDSGTYTLVRTEKQLNDWVDKIRKAGICAFDIETDSLNDMTANPVGFSFSVAEREACYIPIKAPGEDILPEETVFKAISVLMADNNIKVIGQNIKYDYKVLCRWGIRIAHMYFDTMVAAWLIDSTVNVYNMDSLADFYLQYETIKYKDVVEKGKSFADVSLDTACRYAAEDADITFRLYTALKPKLKNESLDSIFYTVEMPLIPILAEMELKGIKLVPEKLKAYNRELNTRLAEIETEIFRLVGHEFNINSTKQLQEILFTERKLKPTKKTKTGYSTDIHVLEELAKEDRVPELVLEHRSLTKLKTTYVETLPNLINEETGRIHTHFLQTGTATGRLSSREPNLQNIPIKDEEGRKIRSAFVPEKGCRFISADYSQIELVVLAHLSGDEELSKAFTTGADVHKRTGALLFGVDENDVTAEQRRLAKTINFGVMYGMSGYRLSREMGIPRKRADQFIEDYFNTYAKIREFIDSTVKEAEKSGLVRTYLGRMRKLPRINSRNRTEKMGAERIAVNTPIQGTAADIMKLAMLNIDSRLKEKEYKTRMILQVHDEVVLEVPENEIEAIEALIRKEMESAVKLNIPLKVNTEIADNWGEMH